MGARGFVRYVPKVTLSADERRRIVGLGHRTTVLAVVLGVSRQTAEELVSPHGEIKADTAERVRARLVELGA